MKIEKPKYKISGLLLSVFLHLIVAAFVLWPSIGLFKAAGQTPIDFYVYPSVNQKQTSTKSNTSLQAQPLIDKQTDPIKNVETKVENAGESKNETGQNTQQTAAAAFGDVTEDALLTSPVEIIKAVKVPYPAEAKRAGISGKVIMTLLVDDTGHVREAKVLSGPGYGLNEAALQAAKNFIFKPAQVKDRKVSVLIRYTYRFDLNNI